ncbi:glycosyltransferase (plasmid) [Sulfitobacter sp. OXR-159]|uniref:glycosyltransferase n=1 Tax=Sulfitobacter sp. OXR-159 TaxID=3100174 RepID=UPI002AC9349C|nr:glycosyltransferase [Sulfitobacter sp. OXR-159]WPZ31538.1 glycosyltransferase [Sulfitobacter sp. OXR-159]
MKIAILLPDLRGGGAERVNLDLAYEFVRGGHTVEFVLQNARGELLEEAQTHFSVVDLKCARMRNLPKKLFHYLRGNRIEVLISAMWPLTVIGPLVGKFVSRKIVAIASEHAILSNSSKSDKRAHRVFRAISALVGYRLANHVVAVSRGVAADISRISWIPQSEIKIINNPLRKFSIERLSSLEKPASLRSPGRTIIGIGSLTRTKNYALLIEAFSCLPTPHNIRLFILGEGPDRPNLEQLIQRKGLERSVFLPGFMGDLRPWFSSADLFVHTSNSEGFGNVLVEALSFGVPVVSTDCPTGPREILQDGKFGVLVPMNDSNALCEAIIGMLDSPMEPSVLTERAADFQSSKIAKKYSSLF